MRSSRRLITHSIRRVAPVRKTLLAVLVLGLAGTIARAATPTGTPDDYFPLKAAPEHHKALFENEFVLVLDVSVPSGVTVPAHRHPWPAVFITLKPSHLVFRNLAGAVVRETRAPMQLAEKPQVEWRKPDTEPISVTNVGDHEQRALRIELKFASR